MGQALHSSCYCAPGALRCCERSIKGDQDGEDVEPSGSGSGARRSMDDEAQLVMQLQTKIDLGGKPGDEARPEASPRRKKDKKGNKDRIGVSSPGQLDGDCEEEQRLAIRRKPREKGLETQKLIKAAMKDNRICGLLEEPELEAILSAMEYFEFDAGCTIVEQGQTGSRFFVTHEGTLSVDCNGQSRPSLGRGTAFGGIGLLYNCPRTATVSCTGPCAVWAANRSTFQEVLKESSGKHYGENRKLVDSISLLHGLTRKQLDAVCEAFFTEVFPTRARVVTEGEDAPTMHVVKSGALRVVKGGVVKSNGDVDGGTEVTRLGPGDSFGERALLHHERRSATVVALERSEVLSVSAGDLQEALGTDLTSCLERNLVYLGLKKSAVLSQFSSAQQAVLAKAMVTRPLGKGAPLEEDFRFLVVLDGTLEGTFAGASGTWTSGQSLSHEDQQQPQAATATLTASTDTGARVAVLTRKALAQALQELGLTDGDVRRSGEVAQKMALVRKVHIFQHLSQDQVLRVVNAFEIQRLKNKEVVFQQGEAGTRFYVIASGEVTVRKSDGTVIRTMGKHGYFGERALLFDEPRSARVDVTSQEAELWYIDKATFSQIVKGNMQQVLMQRIQLQDTSVNLKDLRQVKVIGAGATGVVRLVEHKKTKTRYALKRVKKEDDGTVPADLRRECELLRENDHPFIMKLVKTFETKKNVYMLTELITGGELHGAIRKIPTVLSRAQARFYTGSLLIVIEELADRNIVYRDLKPENVMIDEQGYLKLIDFGIAKKIPEGSTRTFTMVGTPHYMAPEIIRGQGYGTIVDIWSLGVMLFEFVCGYLPFGDDLDDAAEVCAAVLRAELAFPSRYSDPNGKAVMKGMLTRSPKKRLGAGAYGFDELKDAKYFNDGKGDQLFDRIMGRELTAPWKPKEETYCTQEEARSIVLSDADELG
eukprot:TRINITY_DN2047_c0_g8_i1.p1 TRINITY_DN2047_c0_g8~~TRINITY_DN2047_c0_g8_i1.p1  ORF type:complete len:934 (+),score=249.81 TRINITY_DN2047_c0_g8_i1:121-2922(+)